MSKYIITDLDGTLLQDGVVRETDLIKLSKFIDDGNKVVLNTGRSVTLVAHLLKTMPIDYAICNNGNIIVDKCFNVLYKSSANIEELHTVINNIKTPCVINSSNGFDHEHIKDKITIEDPIFLSIVPESRKYKHSKKIAKEIQSHLYDLEAVLNHIYVDVGVRGNNKATGIRFLQNHLNIEDEDILVFGDNLNDVSMFKEFYDNSYFISSGNPEAKKYAKYTVDYVTDILESPEFFDIH